MAGEGRFGVLHVPDFAAGMSSYLRIGKTADDDHTWRDHTDGNRITTTGGDKIEIIRGDYELVVHGRQEHESGMTAKTGKVLQNSITYKGRVKVMDGMLFEETDKGMVDSTYHGDNVDEYYGNAVVSQTGSESPGEEFRDNPELVLEKTWAKKIESYTGSSALRIPLIHDETWVDIKTSKTDAKSTSDETTVEGETKSTTTAKTITSVTTADETKDTTEVTGNMESTTEAAKTISTTHADTDDTTYGNSHAYTKGDSVTVVDGVENTVNLGIVNEVVLGMMNDATIGAETGVSIGGSLHVNIGLEASVTVGASVDVTLAEIELKPSDIKLHLDNTKAALFRKSVALLHLLA
ncbi:Putative cell-wall-anchored protein SasA (LPXTG motif) [Minicystis rosea]|nr:Putative cell-wall-anchored protein SasA (LPXTG motif) [Minicystis rosea]